MSIFLDRIDSVPLYDDEFSFNFSSWLSVLVDTLNETIVELQNQLNGLGDTTFIARKTSAEIDNLIDMNNDPVLEVGAMWFDITISKLKVLVTAAVFGVSDGVTETVMSA